MENSKSYSEMSKKQKKEMLTLYKDKFGIYFENYHLEKIFGDIKDSTFKEFSYDSKTGYIDSFNASFLLDFFSSRILDKKTPKNSASKKEKNDFIDEIQSKVGKEDWSEQLFARGGLPGIKNKISKRKNTP